MAKEQHRRKKKPEPDLATQRFYFLIVTLALTLVFVVASVVLLIVTPWPNTQPSDATQRGIFSVKSIVVEGNTRYQEEAVIGESGVVLGQSIFNVDSQKVEQHLLEIFPYFEQVEVQTLHMKEVKITVSQTNVIGALYSNGYWVSVGENGKALDKIPIVSDRPKGRLYIKGATIPEGGVVIGKPALVEEEAKVLDELFEAFERYQLTDVMEIDLTDLTDITLNWRDQITVRLGGTSNLTHEIGFVASSIPTILEGRGEQITGVLNVSSYSDDSLKDMGVFTPSSLLTTTTAAPRRPLEEDDTTTTTDDITTTTQKSEDGNN